MGIASFILKGKASWKNSRTLFSFFFLEWTKIIRIFATEKGICFI